MTLGFVHLLTDAVEDLGELRSFPIATSLCLAGALCMFFLEQAAALYFHQHDDGDAEDPQRKAVQVVPYPESGHAHMHHHAQISMSYEESKSIIIAHLLELGVVVHSVIIGIGLGVTTDRSGLNSLLIAISFHQLFEGLGLILCERAVVVSFVVVVVD